MAAAALHLGPHALVPQLQLAHCIQAQAPPGLQVITPSGRHAGRDVVGVLALRKEKQRPCKTANEALGWSCIQVGQRLLLHVEQQPPATLGSHCRYRYRRHLPTLISAVTIKQVSERNHE